MNRSSFVVSASASFFTSIALFAGCSSSNGSTNTGPVEQTGQSCSNTSQCYPALGDAAALKGQVTCLNVTNGYCTHTCTTDADCCAVPGECLTGVKQVCSPFQSTGQHYCFLSCDTSVIASTPDAGTTDPNTYCQRFVNASFTCRSTGGGSANLKVCAP
jgi:hypothetical protein